MCPVHDFQCETTGEVLAIYVEIKAPAAEHHTQTVAGKVYKRVYAAPRAARDTRTNDATQQDFMRTTEGKNVTVGDLHKISEEMSAHRADKNGGSDPVKERFYAAHEREYGEKHADVVKREKLASANKRLEEWGISVK